jgi:hypothetical protein
MLKQSCTHPENLELPEDGQGLRSKNVAVIINKQKHWATSWY